MIQKNDVDESLENAELMLMSDEQKSRLATVLDKLLCGIEQGEAGDLQQLKVEHPDIADVLEIYLEKLNFLVRMPRIHNRQSESVGRDAAPQQLGDFTLLTEVGRGGMGVVYEAHQSSLDRKVAIKLLPLASMLDEHQIARFQNEAHAAGLLQHAHIVPVYSVGFEQGIHYFTMQFIDGIPMDSWVQRAKQAELLSVHLSSHSASWDTVVNWGVTIAEALHAAHEAGVVHRDVKPSNLMLDHSGKIWITDFGLARCHNELSLTRSGDVIGTMRYMSPEQARGQNSLIDGRADVYSLAATLYEILSLNPAHEGDDAPAILKNIDGQAIKPIRSFRPELPRDLETVLSKAMARTREERYVTAGEFADDLTRVLNNEPTVARPATIVDHVSRFASKHHDVVLTAILIVAMGFVGLAVANAKLTIAKKISDESAARATRGEQLARDAVDRLGSQTAELLSGIPSAASVRRQLLTETLDYYERFAAEVNDDPNLREDLAITVGKCGALQAELGDSVKAIESLSRSESILAELITLPNTNKSIRLQWSTAQNNLAQALVRTGEQIKAAHYFARAIKTQKEILESNFSSDKQSIRLALATTQNNLGLLLMQSDADTEAQGIFLETEALLTESGQDPTTQARQLLSAVYSNMSGLLTKSSPERAVRYARQALSGQLDALEIDRGNAKLATQTIVTLNTLGAALVAANQNAEAIDTLNRAVDIGKQIFERGPDQPTYRRDLVLSYNQLGLALSRSGQLAKSRDAFAKAIEVGRPLAEMFSTDAEIQSLLGGLLNNLGFLQQQLGEAQAATDAYSEAISMQVHAVRLAPEVKRYRDYLNKHEENYRKIAKLPANGRKTAS